MPRRGAAEPQLNRQPTEVGGGDQVAPEEGIEPPTRRLTAACSATELLRNVEGDDYEQPRFEVKQFETSAMKHLCDAVHFSTGLLGVAPAPAAG